MGRHAKVKNWTADKDLHIIRMSEQSIVNRIKNKQEIVRNATSFPLRSNSVTCVRTIKK